MSHLRTSPRIDSSCRRIGQLALRALHAELCLYPKPGLVSPYDSGAHRDMDAGTFLRSILALRDYFPAIAAAGAEERPFWELQRLGIAAESRMLAATGGVNTHRGAIFSLGLLSAAAGRRARQGLPLTAPALVETLLAQWGAEITLAGLQSSDSNGSRAIRRHGVRGARDEVLDGFPCLMQAALPALQSSDDPEAARVQSLFAVMAVLEDTNLLHRGGAEGLSFVQSRAQAFLDRGGVSHPGWRKAAMALHHDCIERNLSPGGAADMLAAACFLQSLSP